MNRLNKEKLFSYIVFAFSILLITLFVFTYKVNFLFIFVLFGILAALCELFPVKLPKTGTVTISSVVIIASWLSFAPKYGPVPSIIICVFTCFWPDFKKPIHIMLFNCGQYSISVGVSAWLYSALSPVIKIPFSFPVPLIPFIISVVVYHLLNSWLVSISIAFADNASPIKVWLANARWGLPNFLSIAILAIVFHEMFVQNMGYISIVLLLIPLVVTRQNYQYYVKLKSAYAQTISSLIKAVEAKDRYTRGHSERVAEISAKIGKEFHLSEEEIEALKRVAILHDIGKIGVPRKVLTKPVELSEEEYDKIKEHPKIGAQILKNVEFLQGLIPAIYYHHERVDGTGYGSGLSGDNIPLFARIIAIADAYDAMTSNRAYRTALSKEEVVKQFEKGMGTQFDTTLVQKLFDALNLKEEIETPDDKSEAPQAEPVLPVTS